MTHERARERPPALVRRPDLRSYASGASRRGAIAQTAFSRARCDAAGHEVGARSRRELIGQKGAAMVRRLVRRRSRRMMGRSQVVRRRILIPPHAEVRIRAVSASMSNRRECGLLGAVLEAAKDVGDEMVIAACRRPARARSPRFGIR
jgi:hypothetical protein